MSCMMALLSSEPHWSRGSTLLVPYKVLLYFSLLSKLSLTQQREMTTPKAPLSAAGAMFELSGWTWRMRSPRGGELSRRGVLLPSCPPAVPWWPLPNPLLEGASVAAGLKGLCRLLPCVLSGRGVRRSWEEGCLLISVLTWGFPWAPGAVLRLDAVGFFATANRTDWVTSELAVTTTM